MAWTPAQLDDIALWIDAAAPSTYTVGGGNAITEIRDKAGSAAAYGPPPTADLPTLESASVNGLPAFRFNGKAAMYGNETLRAIFNAAPFVNIFAVGVNDPTADPASGPPTDDDPRGILCRWTRSSNTNLRTQLFISNLGVGTDPARGRLEIFLGSVQSVTEPADLPIGVGVPFLLHGESRHSDTAFPIRRIRRFGSVTTSPAIYSSPGNIAAGTSQVASLGGVDPAAVQNLRGRIAEIVCMSVDASPLTKYLIEGYLAGKWGLSLASDHLFAAAAPASGVEYHETALLTPTLGSPAGDFRLPTPQGPDSIGWTALNSSFVDDATYATTFVETSEAVSSAVRYLKPCWQSLIDSLPDDATVIGFELVCRAYGALDSGDFAGDFDYFTGDGSLDTRIFYGTGETEVVLDPVALPAREELLPPASGGFGIRAVATVGGLSISKAQLNEDLVLQVRGIAPVLNEGDIEDQSFEFGLSAASMIIYYTTPAPAPAAGGGRSRNAIKIGMGL